MVIFYPISAATTIFCNIMYDPLHDQVDLDVELLDLATNVVKQMRLRGLPRDETAHLKILDDFLFELARLSHLAVAKAAQEQGNRS